MMLNLPQLASNPIASNYQSLASQANGSLANLDKAQSDLDSVFHQFVGETFYQLMLKSLRNMHDKPAYLHGGQAETLFQNQLDQEVASGLAQTKVGTFSRDLYSVFQSQTKSRAQSASEPN